MSTSNREPDKQQGIAIHTNSIGIDLNTGLHPYALDGD